MTRYVIIGAGAVGVTFAVELQRNGIEVLLVGRGQQLELLRAGKLQYFRPHGVELPQVPTAAGPEEAKLERSDVLVLATKTQQADQVLSEWAQQPVGKGKWRAGEVLPILTLQNGLDSERSALRRFATVVGSVLLTAAHYVADGEIVSPGAPAPGILWIGNFPDGRAAAVVRSIAADLATAGFETQAVDDLSRWKAGKLLASATFVLDGLYGPGPVRDRAAKLVQAEARDILSAADFDAANLRTEGTVRRERFVNHAIAGRERKGNSTWQSLTRGRDIETDFLNGEIVLLARLLGRSAPLNAALQARAQRAVQERSAPGSLSEDDLSELIARTVLVDVPSLQEELAGPRPPFLLDVRWAVGDPDGHKHYLEAHLPNAVYANLDTELAASPTPEGGRHPLPQPGDLQAAARRWGLRVGQSVVVYDNNGGQSAARAWWLLRWAGLADVRILDGGLRVWIDGDGPVETGSVELEYGDVELTGGQLPVLDADDAAGLTTSGVLIDARTGERYHGENEPVDRRAGHIPGAISLPTGDNLSSDGRFLSLAQLRERFADVKGADSVGVYCGSGVTACHEIAALHIAGVDAALYPGSWSAWSADPSRAVATGEA